MHISLSLTIEPMLRWYSCRITFNYWKIVGSLIWYDNLHAITIQDVVIVKQYSSLHCGCFSIDGDMLSPFAKILNFNRIIMFQAFEICYHSKFKNASLQKIMRARGQYPWNKNDIFKAVSILVKSFCIVLFISHILFVYTHVNCRLHCIRNYDVNSRLHWLNSCLFVLWSSSMVWIT